MKRSLLFQLYPAKSFSNLVNSNYCYNINIFIEDRQISSLRIVTLQSLVIVRANFISTLHCPEETLITDN